MFGLTAKNQKNRINLKYDDQYQTADNLDKSHQGSRQHLDKIELALIQMDEKKLKNCVKLNIRNTEVFFPIEPYEVQVKYMEGVINALDNKQNALLQSPTGTGKTLSLLCAALGWLQKQRLEAFTKKNHESEIIKIIYSSRTHSQLKQVAKELKNTVYSPKVCLLGSKTQQCIKSEFRNYDGSHLNLACQKAISGKKQGEQQQTKENEKEGSCRYFNKENLIWLAGVHNKEIMDIEELKKFGQQNTCCPYFFERFRKDNADIILMPYNYLLESSYSNIIDIRNSIIIFDEAHNVSNVAEDGSSFSINQSQLEDAGLELSKWIDLIESDPRMISALNQRKISNKDEIVKTELCPITVGNLKDIRLTIQCLLNYVQSHHANKIFTSFGGDKVIASPGKDMFDILFEKSKVTTGEILQLSQSKGPYAQGITKDNLKNYVQSCIALTEFMKDLMPGFHFQTWQDFILKINNLYQLDIQNSQDKSHWLENPIESYHFLIQKDNNDQMTLKMLCLDPGLAFSRLVKQNTHSIILTSGTLTPFSSWECELRIPFQVQITNSHVCDIKKNLLAGVLQKGQNGTPINFQYSNRENNSVYNELGLTLLNLGACIPNGILVVFSSYSIMNKCRFVWAQLENQILSRLQKLKQCYWEPTVSNEMQDIFIQYQKAAQSKKGAFMFAVCRGKVSEGIDFSDELCRAVFMVGIPYPPVQDKRIELKKLHIDRICFDSSLNKFKKITSKEWYRQQAVRSTNQAIGRVIRHKEDWGAIFLCDLRFDWSDMRNDLSSWVLPVLQNWTDYKKLQEMTSNFFGSRNQLQSIIIQQTSKSDSEDQEEDNISGKKRVQYFGIFLQNNQIKLKMPMKKQDDGKL